MTRSASLPSSRLRRRATTSPSSITPQGVEVEDGGIGLQTIRPAVDLRRSALTALGIAIADLVGGELVLGGAAWRVKSVIENGLELRLIVMQDQ